MRPPPPIATAATPEHFDCLTIARDSGIVDAGPARLCDNCREQFVDEAISTRLLEQAETATKAGVQVEVRSYAA